MLVAALLIPLLLLVATVLLEGFESRVLDVSSRRRTLRTPLRLEGKPVAQRHLRAVPGPMVVDVDPAEVTDEPLPLPRAS